MSKYGLKRLPQRNLIVTNMINVRENRQLEKIYKKFPPIIRIHECLHPIITLDTSSQCFLTLGVTKPVDIIKLVYLLIFFL